MKFIEFNIKNFKGIKETSINLEGGRIFTLVGLNEGGKTTLLEAIHSFSPDADTELVVGSAEDADEQRKQRVPRDKISSFTGDVEVSAEIEFEDGDMNEFIKQAKKEYDLDIQKECLTERFRLKRMIRFKDGELDKNYFLCSIEYKIKTKRQRNYRDSKPEERRALLRLLEGMLPCVAYFPTFVFDFPSKIYLTEGKGTKTNEYYRKLFQDILDYAGDGNELEIQKSIIDRIRKPEARLPWDKFNTWYPTSNEKKQINHVAKRASQAITRVVFDRWKEVFGQKTDGLEIVVECHPDKGQKDDPIEGVPLEHDFYVTIALEHETERFEIEDRSLGFRWFFTFLLFTQFRVARSDGRPVIFLFDEPASNLHAKAQQKLVESFSQIAKYPHILIYTTHSHYMIEPKCLEQTYIVQNGKVDDDDDEDKDKKSLSETIKKVNITGIEAIKYKKFVNLNPSSVSYRQPILDRLDVVLSKFDYNRRGVILEGKSDYAILQYLSGVHFKKDIHFFYSTGATTMDSLISLQKGWGLSVFVLLDDDRAGKKAKKKYMDNYFLQKGEIKCLGELVDDLITIEDLLEEEDLNTIKSFYKLDSEPEKGHISCFFQQHLASNEKIKLSDGMTKKAKKLIKEIEKLMAVEV